MRSYHTPGLQGGSERPFTVACRDSQRQSRDDGADAAVALTPSP